MKLRRHKKSRAVCIRRCACVCAAAVAVFTCGCATVAQDTAQTEATPETAVIVYLTDDPTAAPTETPEPDPICATWTNAAGDFYLTFRADGTYQAAYGETQTAGSYEKTDAAIVFHPADAETYTVSYLLDGSSLTILQTGQTDLTLTQGGAVE